MGNIIIEKEKIEDRSVNYVSINIALESGCDPEDGEYGLYITSFIGSLDLSSHDGVDDISLVKEAVENDIDFSKFPEEGTVKVILKESGEWEGYSWHKYYAIERMTVFDA